jgi:hypothetical protein
MAVPLAVQKQQLVLGIEHEKKVAAKEKVQPTHKEKMSLIKCLFSPKVWEGKGQEFGFVDEEPVQQITRIMPLVVAHLLDQCQPKVMITPHVGHVSFCLCHVLCLKTTSSNQFHFSSSNRER